MSRTFRLRHLPKLGAKKFTESRLRVSNKEEDSEFFEFLAHKWFNYPCIKTIGVRVWSYWRQKWVTRDKTCEECLHEGMVGDGSHSSSPWKFVRQMRKKMPRSIACVWFHPWVGMNYGGGKRKGYRIRRNRDYRRAVRAAERKSYFEDDVVFPIYRKCVIYDLY